jgi:L-threonylcarbamoyladenylate synthase
MSLILKVGENSSQNRNAIQEGARIILRGGVVAFPTETVYGLAALASNPEAVERVYLLKNRPRQKSLSILVSDVSELQNLVQAIPPGVPHLIKLFWPGPLTLIFSAAGYLPPGLTAGGGKVGVRISSHPVAQALVQEVGAPVTATSANRSGSPSCRSPVQVLDQLGLELEAIVDGGLTPGSKDSTIADVTTRPPEILRVGSIPARDVLSCWEQGVESR